MNPSSPEPSALRARRQERILRSSLAGVASNGAVVSRPPSSAPSAPAVRLCSLAYGGRPSGEGRLWPGEATPLAAAVLWLLVLLYVGAHAWGAMVNDSRSDVGAYGDN